MTVLCQNLKKTIFLPKQPKVFFRVYKVRLAGGAPAQSCEGRTGPSLHPPHPWPTLPFSKRQLYNPFINRIRLA